MTNPNLKTIKSPIQSLMLVPSTGLEPALFGLGNHCIIHYAMRADTLTIFTDYECHKQITDYPFIHTQLVSYSFNHSSG